MRHINGKIVDHNMVAVSVLTLFSETSIVDMRDSSNPLFPNDLGHPDEAI